MYSLNINNDKIIHDLEIYMLNSIKTGCLEIVNDKIKKIKNEKPYIPRNNIFVNYNKLKSNIMKNL